VTATITTATAASINSALTNGSSSDALTITVSAGTVAATDLTALDGKTSVAVNASNVTTLTGTIAQVQAAYDANTAGTITGLGNENITITDTGTITSTVLNDLIGETSGTISIGTVTINVASGNTLNLSSITSTGTITINDSTGNENIIGTAGNDVLNLSTGNDTVNLGDGSDTINISHTNLNISDNISDSGTTGTDGYRGFIQYNHTNDALIFGTSGAEDMRIDSSGNVMIGSTASSYRLSAIVASGADRALVQAGVSGISNGFTVNYVNSNTSMAYRFTSLVTTASAANAFLDSGDDNRLYRSTSSLRYKKDIENIEQSKSDAVLNLRPVWYRSKADNDNSDWSWYGLIAEEVAEVEPRLVHWSYLDSDYDVKEENGSIKKTLKADAKLIPDGVQYERVTVLLLDVVKRQEQAIQELKAELDSVKAELQTLKGA
jgi:hypothetical protein